MQWWERLKSKVRGTPAAATDSYGFGTAQPATAAGTADPSPARRRWRWRFGTAAGLLLVLLGYYLIGAVLLTRIDAKPGFRPSSIDLPPGGSETVAMMSALLDREVNGYGWKPNNPLIYPTALMDNMPNYQIGIWSLLRNSSIALRDGVARMRGAGGTDKDLETAAAALSYPPDRWFIGSKFPYLGMSSESFYKDAIAALRSYNTRVGTGQAVYERRVDTLVRTLDQIANSLGNAANDLDKTMQQPGGIFDTDADDVYYRARGQSYAAYMMLSALRNDFSTVVRDRSVANLWVDMLDELKQGMALEPLIVSNGNSDDVLVQNHLAAQGVHIERARQRLREISGILQQ